MSAPLDKLASYLAELKIVKRQYEHLDEEWFKLIIRRGVFLTKMWTRWKSWMSHHLQPFIQWNGDWRWLRTCAQTVELFNLSTLGEYSDFYLKTDVLLLAGVFEAFRDSCLQIYGLDPAHYYTAPGLTWDAMLKYTQIELELITDIDTMLLIERNIWGGVNQCSNGYAKANHKYMESFDRTKLSHYNT